jgi:hypothetical protein
MIWVLVLNVALSVLALIGGDHDMAIWLLVGANLTAQFVIQELNEGGKR